MKFRQSAIVFPGAIVLSIIFVFAFIASTFTTPVSVSAQKAVKSDSGEGQDVVMQLAAPAATFPGSGFGAIPDNLPGTPLNVTFNVTGITGAPTNVEVSHTYSPIHTWAGDINCTLIAPNGTSFVIYGRTGQTGASAGDSSDLSGPYNFKDTAAGTNWWAAANTAGAAAVIPPGDYRTTQTGPQPVITTSPVTNLTAAFAGVANPNGTWTLRFTDNAAGDTGSISAAVLTIVGAVAPGDTNADFDGDGKTDFVVARATTTPLTEATAPGMAPIARMVRDPEVKGRFKPTGSNETAIAPPIYWYSKLSGSGATGIGQLGDAATDFILTEDFDGDGKDDLTVWTEAPATQANFKILQSSTNTVRVEFFGQTNDDPQVVGDYDGDGKADPAVYRCPPFGGAAGQCFFYYRGSLANPSGNVTYVPWGSGVDGDFFPYIGDFDGDGKNDFCVQRTAPSGTPQGQFVLLKSGGGAVEYINWGNDSDAILPGDYDGDGKTDFCVRRTQSGLRQHYILTRTGAQSQTQWGITGDVSAPGDYDGDGKTDLAIWRPNVNPDLNFFWVLNSSNSSVTQFEWGQNADFPVAGWAVH